MSATRFVISLKPVAVNFVPKSWLRCPVPISATTSYVLGLQSQRSATVRRRRSTNRGEVSVSSFTVSGTGFKRLSFVSTYALSPEEVGDPDTPGMV